MENWLRRPIRQPSKYHGAKPNPVGGGLVQIKSGKQFFCNKPPFREVFLFYMARPSLEQISRNGLPIPTAATPSGIFLVEGALPTANGKAPHIDTSSFRPDRKTGLLVPDRALVKGPFDIVRITDFGGGHGRDDFANVEVDLNLTAVAEEYGLEVAHVISGHNDKFATENTGYQTWQALVNKDHKGRTRVGYVNTNSRYSPGDNRSWTGKDNSNELVYARLDNGTHLFTVDRGSNLSYVKPHIVEGHVLDGHRVDQFLSRGPFIEVAFDVLSGGTDHISGSLDVEAIPDPRKGAIVAIDGTDNLKSNITVSELVAEPGIATSPYLSVFIDGGEPVIAKNGLVPNLVEIGQGNFVVRGGSSGYLDTGLPDGQNFVEVQAMFASAVDVLGHNGRVTDETHVSIQPIFDVTRAVTEQANRNYYLEQKATRREIIVFDGAR